MPDALPVIVFPPSANVPASTCRLRVTVIEVFSAPVAVCVPAGAHVRSAKETPDGNTGLVVVIPLM